MQRKQLTFWSILVGATALALVIASTTTDEPARPDGTSPGFDASPHIIAPPIGRAEVVDISIASSVTKQKWMEAAIAAFHASNTRLENGKRIRVNVDGVLSGGSMEKILRDDLKPTAWSPGASSWTAQFAARRQQRGLAPLSSKACEPTVYSPIGLAMWRPMAEALGWPDKPVQWQTVVDLAEDPQGWASFGHPEWGQFKLGHPHPKYSSAGMLFMTSLVHGVTGKSELSVDDVYSDTVERSMRSFAQATTKYGMVSTDLLRMMAEQGPQFLHAVSAFEEGTVRLNLTRGDQLRWPMVFIFPADGTFWSSHPYCVFDKAAWVSEDQATAAQLFFTFLREPKQQTLAVQHLLRPLDQHIAVSAPLSMENGADPRIGLASVPALPMPTADVTAAIVDQFVTTKRKGTVYVMLDVSGSMKGDKMAAATKATASFLRRLHDSDRVRVGTFSGDVNWLGESADVSSHVESLVPQVLNLYAGGSTALHDAVCATMEGIEAEREADLKADDRRLYGIVLLSDGRSSGGETSETKMFSTCLPRGAEDNVVKVFPIAFGSDADSDLLTRVAHVTRGRMYTAEASSIDRAYLRISAEQ